MVRTISGTSCGLRIPATVSRAAAAFLGCIWSLPASAHGFGRRYDLPIPLPFYLAGAGLVVGLSFFVAIAFLRRGTDVPPAAPGSSPAATSSRPVAGPLVVLGQAVGVFCWLLVIIAGLFGTKDPFRNIAPFAVWVVLWVGGVLASGLAGDVWKLINPWSAVAAWVGPRRGAAPPLAYPGRLGCWPAVVLLLGLAWAELLWNGSDHPRQLAGLILAYSALTFAGMALFGPATWLANGEVLSVAFGLFARCGPLAVDTARASWRLRLPFAGLREDLPYSASRSAFVLVLLSCATFDGLSETPAWAAVMGGLREMELGGALGATIGLMVLPVLCAAVFAGTVWVCGRGAGDTGGMARLFGCFVPSLLPIILGYHLAHNLAFLRLGLEYLVPILSDPLGRGWDLFGTTLYQVNPGVADAALLWYVAIGAIVLGHIIAVVLAHGTALRLFPDRLAAVRSQWPMMTLMVAYTMSSLWILAQPITNSRAGG